MTRKTSAPIIIAGMLLTTAVFGSDSGSSGNSSGENSSIEG